MLNFYPWYETQDSNYEEPMNYNFLKINEKENQGLNA